MLVVPICAYGPWHIETARYLLASLRSEGNLPYGKSHVIVYTDEPAAFPGLHTVRIRVKDPSAKHELNMRCYRHALRLGHPIVPLSADMICPTGLLAALEKHAADKRLVVCPVIRVTASYFKKRFGAGVANGEPLVLPVRELMRLSIKHVHHRQRGMYWPNIGPTNAPTTIFRLRGQTVVARCFHMHPLMVNAPIGPGMTKSMDAEFVGSVPLEQVHVITDSDETAVVDMCDVRYAWEQTTRTLPPIMTWVALKTTPRHRWFFTHECYLHAAEIEHPPYDPAYQELLEDVMAMDAPRGPAPSEQGGDHREAV